MTPAQKGPNLQTFTGRVAARIRRLREKSGMTVEQFAAKVSELAGTDISVSTAYGWENGNSSPNLKMLPPIAKALGLHKVRNLLPDE